MCGTGGGGWSRSFGVCAAVLKHTHSEAAVINMHLYAYLLSPAETVLKLHETFEMIQLHLKS